MTQGLALDGVCKYYISSIGRNTTSARPIGGVSLMSAAAATAESRPMGLGSGWKVSHTPFLLLVPIIDDTVIMRQLPHFRIKIKSFLGL